MSARAGHERNAPFAALNMPRAVYAQVKRLAHIVQARSDCDCDCERAAAEAD
ncbi:hypothetical protein [Pseudomonas sp. RT6P73]